MDYHEVTKKKEWDLVIKVKYGDTLRRFVISVHGCLVNYNMNELREKIISLFKLHYDANLTLSYIDGDNDVITLDNDDELRDATINQRLNPLRINVQLKTNGNCDPQSEIGSSTSALANLVQCFAKIGFTDADQSSRAVASGFPGQSSGSLRNLMDLKASDEPKTSIGPVSTTITLSNTNSGIRFLEDTSTNYGSVNRTHGPQGTAQMSVDLNLDPSKNPHEQEMTVSASPSDQATGHSSNNYAAPKPSPTNLAKGATEASDGDNYNLFSASALFSQYDHRPQIHMINKTAVHLPKDPKPSSLHLPTRCRSTHSYHDSMFRVTHKNVQCDGCRMYPIMGSRYKSKVKQDYDLCYLCFLEMGNDADYTKLEKDNGPNNTRMDHARIAHKNVHCDGCRMYPIMGPRYKSKVKYDYDLCYSCFLEMGNEAEYTKLEKDNGPNDTELEPLVDATANMDMKPVAMDELPNANEGLAQPMPLKQTSVDTYSKQIDLNMGVLGVDKYEENQSMDDFCGYANWEPLLVELQEMGFNDKELNKKLLVQNGGSITITVLDLIGGKY